MTTPKPAPSKPLSFRPPEFLKGETKSSELPFVEGESTESKVVSKKPRKVRKNESAVKNSGARPNIVMFDEAAAMAGEAVKNFNDSFDPETAKKEAKKPAVKDVKKPFVLNPHLTQRPFHDDRLMQLKSRLQRPSFKNR